MHQKAFIVPRSIVLDGGLKRMKDEIKNLNRLVKQMIGPRMTKEQLDFQDELRRKVKAKEITVDEAHRIWKDKYDQCQE
jgi:hypothetical protein